MNTEEIHLLGLIGLRALAEFDIAEYRRSTDLSLGELEDKIERLLTRNEIVNAESQELYNKLMEARKMSQTPIELTFFFQQIYASTSIRVQYLSLQLNRQRMTERRISDRREWIVTDVESEIDSDVSEKEELVRLSAMQMLNHLHGYSHTFQWRLGDINIDCALQPPSSALPTVLLAALPILHSRNQLDQYIEHLQRAILFLGLKALGIIIIGKNELEIYGEI